MATAAQSARSILEEFDLPSRREGRERDAYADAFQGIGGGKGEIEPANGEIVQVKGKGGLGGGKPRKDAPDVPDGNGRNRKDGNGNDRRREFDLDLDNGQQDSQGQGQSGSNGLALAWDSPLKLVDGLVSASSPDGGSAPERPAYGMTIGHKSRRVART
ncbi:hypothetical protein ACFOVU_19500 [Nocardiopsis sediminis]|uniref:Uncharacterized protein n=1 Tax=Nocardiopsis sediminis TaxID=1778267 RepID=A0ABV8FPN5_9ACTN